MRDHRSSSATSRTSTPSTRTAPPVTSNSRGTRLSKVDLPEPVEPMIAVVLPGSATRSTPCRTAFSAPGYRNSTPRSSMRPRPSAGKTVPLQDGLLRGGVPELGAAQLDAATPLGGEDHGPLGLDHGRFRVEDLTDALGRDHRPRHHDEHHRRHHHAHEDEGDVRQERDERPDLHLTGLDATRAEPEHRRAREVEHEHHEGEHERHDLADTQGHVEQALVRLGEPLPLTRLTDEGPDDADPRDLLAHDAVDLVDALLHRAEHRDHAPHDEGDDPREDGDRDEQDA